IHKPEFCLTSQGWRIVGRETESIPLDDIPGYELPVRKFTANFVGTDSSGRLVRGSGVYVFWFVADQRVAADHFDRIKQMTWDLLRTGTLPRWAYVSCFATCAPGAEQKTYDRMRRFLSAAVPMFQTSFPSPRNVHRIAADQKRQQGFQPQNQMKN
ncbi:MAG: EpsI family protein, partial [Verrucomicrobiae bacterium]|nr:EpsI family protein [Verrucomicrobiae bacterium]